MSRNGIENDGQFGGTSCCGEGADAFAGCGDMRQMMQGSPCAGFLKRHRLAVYTFATLAGLGFLILQAGWLLGIIAFFRTL